MAQSSERVVLGDPAHAHAAGARHHAPPGASEAVRAMAVDWDALEPHDEIDGLLTERNAAQAEARLWLRRLLHTQRELDQAKRGQYATDKNLSEWAAAHAELLRAFRRLENAHENLKWERDYYRSLVGYLDPFLPRWLQDEEKRAANEALYLALAESRGYSIT